MTSVWHVDIYVTYTYDSSYVLSLQLFTNNHYWWWEKKMKKKNKEEKRWKARLIKTLTVDCLIGRGRGWRSNVIEEIFQLSCKCRSSFISGCSLGLWGEFTLLLDTDFERGPPIFVFFFFSETTHAIPINFIYLDTVRFDTSVFAAILSLGSERSQLMTISQMISGDSDSSRKNRSPVGERRQRHLLFVQM